MKDSFYELSRAIYKTVIHFSIIAFSLTYLSCNEVGAKTIFKESYLRGISVVQYEGRERFIGLFGPLLVEIDTDTLKTEVLCAISTRPHYKLEEAGANHLNGFPLKIRQVGNHILLLTYSSFIAINIEDCFKNGRADGGLSIKSRLIAKKAPTIVKYANVTYHFCDFIFDKQYVFLIDCTGNIKQFDVTDFNLTAENRPFHMELDYIFSTGLRQAGPSPSLKLEDSEDELIVYGKFATENGITGNDFFREVRVDKFTLSLNSMEQAFASKPSRPEGCYLNNLLSTMKLDDKRIFIGLKSENDIMVVMEKDRQCFDLSNRTFFKDIDLRPVKLPSSEMINRNLVYDGDVFDIVKEKRYFLKVDEEIKNKCRKSFNSMALKRDKSSLFLCVNAGWYEGKNYLIYSDDLFLK